MIAIEEEENEAKDSLVTSFDMRSGTVVNSTLKVDYKKHQDEAKSFLKTKEKEEDDNREYVDKFEMDTRLKKNQAEILDGINAKYQNLAKQTGSNKTHHLNFNSKIEHDDMYEDFSKAQVKIQKIKQELLQNNVIPAEAFDKELYPNPKFSTACLSMWQPWASLLVYGIKRFEGRSWSTEFRGPLWIHAGSREPTSSEIKQVEDQYRLLYSQDPNVQLPEFPNEYPTGCLLGVIDLQDVITQDIYKKHIPHQYTKESTDDYLFVSRNPRRLKVTIRLPGKSGIFNLEEQLVETAVNTLVKVPQNWFPYHADKIPSMIDQGLTLEKQNSKAVEFSQSTRPKPVFSIIDVAENNFLKVGKLKDDWINSHLHPWMSQFLQVFAGQIQNGPSGSKLMTFDKTVPKYNTIVEVLSRVYTDLKDQFYDEDSAMGK